MTVFPKGTGVVTGNDGDTSVQGEARFDPKGTGEVKPVEVDLSTRGAN